MWPQRTDARVGVQIDRNSYLTRTDDLKSTSQSGVVLVGQVRPVFTISLALRTCSWAMNVQTFRSYQQEGVGGVVETQSFLETNSISWYSAWQTGQPLCIKYDVTAQARSTGT
jgi:hypothetical protein